MSSLLVDWCSYEAAKFAVMNWHYSKRMPMPPRATIGVWEDGKFIGAVIFARGNSPSLGKPYGLKQVENCELVRIALKEHKTTVSKIGMQSIKILSSNNSGLRLLVSFADPKQGHNGGIYQAMNWVYSGCSSADWEYYYQGRWQHSREIRGGAYGHPRKLKDYSMLPKRSVEGKHRYLYPLDRAMRRQILPLAQPYPKKEHAGEVSTVTRRNQPEIAGSSPAARSEMTGQEPVLVR